MKITSEMLENAKKIENLEELVALAKEKEIDATEERIKEFYETNHKSGELNDDELDNVAGGWCYNGGRPIITVGEQHDCFVCKWCANKNKEDLRSYVGTVHSCSARNRYLETVNNCDNCRYCIYEDGLWLCDNPANRK